LNDDNWYKTSTEELLQKAQDYIKSIDLDDLNTNWRPQDELGTIATDVYSRVNIFKTLLNAAKSHFQGLSDFYGAGIGNVFTGAVSRLDALGNIVSGIQSDMAEYNTKEEFSAAQRVSGNWSNMDESVKGLTLEGEQTKHDVASWLSGQDYTTLYKVMSGSQDLGSFRRDYTDTFSDTDVETVIKELKKYQLEHPEYTSGNGEILWSNVILGYMTQVKGNIGILESQKNTAEKQTELEKDPQYQIEQSIKSMPGFYAIQVTDIPVHNSSSSNLMDDARPEDLSLDDQKVYQYLLNTQGQSAAAAYFKYKKPTLNAAKRARLAREITDGWGGLEPYIMAIPLAVVDFGAGLANGVSSLWGADPIDDPIVGVMPQVANNIGGLGGGAIKFEYGLGQAIPYMAVWAAAALATPETGGGSLALAATITSSVMAGLQGKGDAYLSAIQSGYSKDQAITYSWAAGLASAAAQFAIGAIPGGGAILRGGESVAKSIVSEVIDRAVVKASANSLTQVSIRVISQVAQKVGTGMVISAVMQPVMTAVRNIALGENNSLFSDDYLENIIVGGLVTGAIMLPGIIAKNLEIYQAGKGIVDNGQMGEVQLRGLMQGNEMAKTVSGLAEANRPLSSFTMGMLDRANNIYARANPRSDALFQAAKAAYANGVRSPAETGMAPYSNNGLANLQSAANDMANRPWIENNTRLLMMAGVSASTARAMSAEIMQIHPVALQRLIESGYLKVNANGSVMFAGNGGGSNNRLTNPENGGIISRNGLDRNWSNGSNGGGNPPTPPPKVPVTELGSGTWLDDVIKSTNARGKLMYDGKPVDSLNGLRLRANEKTVWEDLLATGNDVDLIPVSKEGLPTSDSFLNGVNTELKAMTGSSPKTAATRIEEAFKKPGVKVALIDVRAGTITARQAWDAINEALRKGDIPEGGKVIIWTNEGFVIYP